MRKAKFTKGTGQRGNLVAQEYLEKIKNGNVNLDRAYEVLVNCMREQRMLKLIEIGAKTSKS